LVNDSIVTRTTPSGGQEVIGRIVTRERASDKISTMQIFIALAPEVIKFEKISLENIAPRDLFEQRKYHFFYIAI
jgi:hypothetical protein